MHLRKAISSATSRTRIIVRQRVASLWNYTYRVQYRLEQYRRRYAVIAILAVLILLVAVIFYVSPPLQAALEPHFTTEDAVHGLQRLLLNVGTALIGVAAIVTSLVLFAMQVNIERMPHGLFRRLSTDRRLLGAFKGGRYITGWGVLERGLCASAAFALTGDDGEVDALKTDIRACLQDERSPKREVTEHAARGIRMRADNPPALGHRSSSI